MTIVRGWKLREIPGQRLRDGEVAEFSSSSSTAANPPLLDVYAVNSLQAGGHAHVPQLKTAAF